MKLSTFPATLRRKLRPTMCAALTPLLSLALAAPAVAWHLSAEVKLYDANYNRVGKATLSQRGGDEVVVEVRVRDLPPGFHGFHVHAIGKCERPGFTSAGGHFNLPHLVASHRNHSGDFPVLLVNEDGTAEATFGTDRFPLADLFDADGSALIIHANPDNYANIPVARYDPDPDETTLNTGDAGDRIACGVIEKVITRGRDK
ncbi:MAG: superoxide dismutase family protein [Noviherbaspirillum sp.]